MEKIKAIKKALVESSYQKEMKTIIQSISKFYNKLPFQRKVNITNDLSDAIQSLNKVVRYL